MNRAPLPASDDRGTFRRLADGIAAAAADDVRILPYEDEDLPHFRALNPRARAAVLIRLGHVSDAVEAVRRAGERVLSAQLIWAYLKNVRHTAPAELIGRIDDADTVDFYGLDHQLTFANLTFFRTTSYSLEQLYCVPWPLLYARDRHDIGPVLENLCARVSSPKCPGILDASHVPEHLAWETISRGKVRARVRARFCAPIYDRGVNAGYLWVNRHTPVKD